MAKESTWKDTGKRSVKMEIVKAVTSQIVCPCGKKAATVKKFCGDEIMVKIETKCPDCDGDIKAEV